jgi:hypothetical protein
MIKCKNFLHEVARLWMSEVQNSTSPVLMNCNGHRRNQHQGGRNRAPPPGRLSRDFSKHKLDKVVADGEGKKKYVGYCMLLL